MTPGSTIRQEAQSASPTASHRSDVNASQTEKVGYIAAYVHPETYGRHDGDTPLGCSDHPNESAGIYILLASDEGSYLTGGFSAGIGGTPLR